VPHPYAFCKSGIPQTLPTRPLSTEQMEIYRAFLVHWTWQKKQVPMAASKGSTSMRQNIQTRPSTSSTRRQLPKNIVLVDPDRQSTVIKGNDPDRTMRQGTPVKDAVDAAFASGLLTLSEFAFDKTHRYAVMSFSFVCGALCGHGETIIFQKLNGKWNRTERRCGGWVS
jgi:hypothetical protein